MTNVVDFNQPQLPQRNKLSPGRRWPWRDLPRAEEVYATYLTPHSRWAIRVVLEKRDGGDIWQMILDAIDAGFVTANRNVIGNSASRKVTLRLLFSNWPTYSRRSSLANRYNLLDAQHRQFVREVIMPIALANREAVLADPTCLDKLVTFRPSTQQGITRANAPKPAALHPVTEKPASMYGMQLWPRPGNAVYYSYAQMRAACRYFQDQLHLCEQSRAFPGPKDRAWAIRQSTRTLQAYCDRVVLNLTDQIATAMEFNPGGECNPPLMPPDMSW
jgi:hypothetical protein